MLMCTIFLAEMVLAPLVEMEMLYPQFPCRNGLAGFSIVYFTFTETFSKVLISYSCELFGLEPLVLFSIKHENYCGA